MTVSPRYSVGDRVRLAGDEQSQGAIVGAGQRFGSTIYYDVLVDSETLLYPQDDLELIEAATRSPVSWLVDQPLRDAKEFGEFLTLLKLGSRFSDILYSYLSSRTMFRVYQFKPVLKLLESPFQRILIADEVGLGKTIEAGLIWSELDARMTLDRVLVVCPSGLRRKWQLELHRRFDRDVPILSTSSQLREELERFVRQPETASFYGIAGLEMLRQEPNLEKLREVGASFDLVIVDEAHHMRNTGTLSYELGEFLSESADYLLLLTATPLNLGQPDLFNLMHLLLEEEFDNFEVFQRLLEPNRWITDSLRLLNDIPPDREASLAALRKVESTALARRFVLNPYYQEAVNDLESLTEVTRRDVVRLQRKLTELNTLSRVYNRTRKRDLAERLAVRRAWRLDVNWTESEWNLYLSVRRHVATRLQRLTGSLKGIGFATVMPERQASSCLPAMRDYLQQTIESHRFAVDLSEGEEDLEEGLDGVAPTLEESELASVRDLLRAVNGLGSTDSKFDVFTAHLADIFQRDGRSQVLVFSFFKATLKYLEQRLLAQGFSVGRMDGSTPSQGRERLMEDFRLGTIQILLSSEVGAEGLDFEFCQYLINYDLPWNPMRLEQRIGRLDRFGQLHEHIVIANFHIPGTIDSDIFQRLYDRIGIFERSIGELEPILGPVLRDLNANVISAPLSSEERQREADRIATAIEGRREDIERFEEMRERLVGNDEYVVEQLEEIARERKYVTADELERFFVGFLKRAIGRQFQLQPDQRDEHVFYFTANPSFAELLRRHAGVRDPAVARMAAALEAGSGLKVTFDSDAAYKWQAEFLNFRHPFIATAIDYYRAQQRLHRAGQIQIQHDREGEFIFFLCRLEAGGLVPKLNLLSVAVDLHRKQVDPEVSSLILPALSDERAETPDGHPVLLMEELDRCYEEAMHFVDRRREELKKELLRTNEALALARQESLEQSRELRVSRISQLLDQTRDERIRRMRVAQIGNIEQRVSAKLEELERKKGVNVSVQVLAGGYARTVQTGSQSSQ